MSIETQTPPPETTAPSETGFNRDILSKFVKASELDEVSREAAKKDLSPLRRADKREEIPIRFIDTESTQVPTHELEPEDPSTSEKAIELPAPVQTEETEIMPEKSGKRSRLAQKIAALALGVGALFGAAGDTSHEKPQPAVQAPVERMQDTIGQIIDTQNARKIQEALDQAEAKLGAVKAQQELDEMTQKLDRSESSQTVQGSIDQKR